MNFSTITFNKIPPLVILRGYQLTVCGSRGEAHRWLKQEHIRQSDVFVIYDPCGCLFKRYEKDFIRNGYDIKCLNAPCFCDSPKYNPFEYLRTDEDIQIMASALIDGTKGDGKSGDIEFELAENLLLSSCISYVHDNAPSFEHHLGTVLEMLKIIDKREDYREGDKTAVDYLFEAFEEREPFHLSVRLYKQFKEIAGENEQKIVGSCVKRLYPLELIEVGEYMTEDELGLDNLLFSKTALFVRIMNPYPAFQFIVPLMYKQFFNVIGKQIVQ